MKKSIIMIIAGCIVLALISGCSKETDGNTLNISQLIAMTNLGSAVENPNVLVDSYELVKNNKLDVSNMPSGWEEMEGNKLLNYYVCSNDNGGMMITVGHRNKKIVSIDANDITNGALSSEKSLDRYINAYHILRDRLGEPQTHNVDILYSSDENVPVSEIEAYLNNHDCNHSYYLEWEMQDGGSVSIDYQGSNSTVPTGITVAANYPYK